jgi:hypothetical protein
LYAACPSINSIRADLPHEIVSLVADDLRRIRAKFPIRLVDIRNKVVD